MTWREYVCDMVESDQGGRGGYSSQRGEGWLLWADLDMISGRPGVERITRHLQKTWAYTCYHFLLRLSRVYPLFQYRNNAWKYGIPLRAVLWSSNITSLSKSSEKRPAKPLGEVPGRKCRWEWGPLFGARLSVDDILLESHNNSVK